VERPALAGQAPQLNNATPPAGTQPTQDWLDIHGRWVVRWYLGVVVRMGAHGIDRHAVGELYKIQDLTVPGGAHVYADKQLVVLRTILPAGISFAGEIDASNSHAVGSSIATALAPNRDIHVDVSSLQFCDISGIRAFVSVAEGLPKGRRLLLHGLPTQLETVIKVVGWNRIPALVVCKCGVD